MCDHTAGGPWNGRQLSGVLVSSRGPYEGEAGGQRREVTMRAEARLGEAASRGPQPLQMLEKAKERTPPGASRGNQPVTA